MGDTTQQLVETAISYPDYLVIVVVFLVFAGYGFARGTKAVSELAVALPVAAFVFALMPFDLGWAESALFGVLAIVSAWVLARDTSGLDDDSDLHKIAMSALGATGLLLVISAGIVDFTPLYTFGNPIVGILVDDTYKFYIAAASLILIAFSRKV